MAIEFLCKVCNTTLRVPDEHLGKKAKCPNCQSVNVIQPAYEAPVGTPMPPQKIEGGSPFQANPYSASNVMPGGIAGSAYQSPHRGSLVLTLGILALVCNFCLVPGIMAWAFGHSDLKEIDAGRMDPEGRGMTQAGKILGMIGTILPLVIMLIYIAFIIIFLVFGVAAAAGGGGF